MNTRHLTEEEIIRMAGIGGTGEGSEAMEGRGAEGGTDAERGAELYAHVQLCESCRASVAAYRTLFQAIAQQPVPGFDFDLSAAVLSRLSPEMGGVPETAVPVVAQANVSKAPGRDVLNWLIPLLAVGAMGTPVYLFRKYLLTLFGGMSVMLGGLAVITAAGLVLFQGIAIYREYQRKIDALNLY